MNIIESTIAFLFRPAVDPSRAEAHRQKTCRILRNITDPAAWTYSNDSTSSAWASVTMALRGA